MGALIVALALAATGPVTVRASFDHSIVQLGDPIVATVVVAGSTSPIDFSLAPLTPLGPRRTTRSGDVVTITQRAACLTAACLERSIDLPNVRVGATVAAWPRLRVRPRVGPGDVARVTPRFAADTTLPAPTYRVSPGAVAALDVVAALAALGALALVVLAVRRRRPVATDDELTRALRLVREAEARPAPDRRRALGLLARLLRGRPQHRAATDLAWARPEPQPDAVEALVDDVERAQ